MVTGTFDEAPAVVVLKNPEVVAIGQVCDEVSGASVVDVSRSTVRVVVVVISRICVPPFAPGCIFLWSSVLVTTTVDTASIPAMLIPPGPAAIGAAFEPPRKHLHSMARRVSLFTLWRKSGIALGAAVSTAPRTNLVT